MIGFDVKRFVASPFYAAPDRRRRGPTPCATLEEKTGINPERDLDQIVIAGRATGPRARRSRSSSGRFDRQKLGRAIETERKDQVTWKDVQGTTVYLFREGGQRADCARLPRRPLRSSSARRTAWRPRSATACAARRGCCGNAALTALLEKLRPGSTFWMVGDQSLLANLPEERDRARAAAPRCTLPALAASA